MTTRKPSQRYFRALALEPRILLDAAAVTTAAEVAAQVNTPATADAPGVEVTPTKSTVTITDNTDVFPAQVDLFQGADVSLDSAGQKIKELVISVSSSGANQALVLDGTQLLLAPNSDVTPFTNSGYQYSVSVAGDTTTITLNFEADDGITAEDAEKLINDMQYQVLDKSLDSGSVKVTLKSLEDTGGQTLQLDASATIAIDNQINVAPVLESDVALQIRESLTQAGLGNTTEVVYSSDGKHLYAANASGVIAHFSIDAQGRLGIGQVFTGIADLNSIADLTLSTDGKSLYAISGSNVVALDIDSNGALSAARPYSAGDDVRNLAISSDGKQVYVSTEFNGLTIFNRDTTTGDLSHIQTIDEGGLANGRTRTVVSAGNYVFVASGNSLVTLERGADGKLTKLQFGSLNTGIMPNTSPSLAASTDGRFVFISEGSTIRAYTLAGSDGKTLVSLGNTTLANVTALAISADAKHLYATASNGSLTVYSISAIGELGSPVTLTGANAAAALAVSADGLNVVVAGSTLTRYSSMQSLTLGQANEFADKLTLKDANFDVLDSGTGNYKGASLVITPSVNGGTFGFSAQNGLSLSGSSIVDGSTPIAQFTVGNDGKLTVKFTADTSKAVANQVLQQLSYSAAANAVAGSLMTLRVQVSDGALSSDIVNVALRVNSAPQGSVDIYTPPKATTETAYNVTLPDTLFRDADGDKLAWSISVLPDGLTFDAATRTLSGTPTVPGTHTLTLVATDPNGQSASVEVVLEVEQIANRAPVVSADAISSLPAVVVGTAGYSQVLPAALFSDADAPYSDSTLTWSVSGLPTGLSFDAATRTLSGTPNTVSDYALVVTVTDEHGASAQHTVELRVISKAEADNRPPALNQNADDLTYSNKGKLSGYGNYVNSLVQSSDGSLLVIAGSTNWTHPTVNATSAASQGSNYLSVYQRDSATGALTLLQTLRYGTQDDGNAGNGVEIALSGITSITFSDDGKHLYAAGGTTSDGPSTNHTIAIFNVGADGTLTLAGNIGDLGEKVMAVSTDNDGDHLYVLTPTKLYSYTVGEGGGLTLDQTFQTTNSTNFGTAVSIAVDNEGTLYVRGLNRLAIFTRDSSSADLAYRGVFSTSSTALQWTPAGALAAIDVGTLSNASAFSNGRSIAVSDDGYIYLTAMNATGAISGTLGYITVLHYDNTTGDVSLVQDFSANSTFSGPVGSLALSADGKALYAGGYASTRMAIYSVGEDGKLTLASSMATDVRGTRILVSADGKTIYFGSNINGVSTTGLGSLSANMDIATGSYTEGSVITPAAGLTLSDTEYDAQATGTGNYNGATLTLQREGTANPDDSFGLSANNGLTLVGEEIRLNDEKIATLSNVDGKLTITFTADVSTTTANAVLRQITYTNTSDDPGASIRLTLGVKDQFASGTDSITLALAVTQINDAPQVSATPRPNLSQDAGRAAVAVFSGAAISTERGQLISSLTFTVSGLKDGASETLRIDSSNIALVAGSGTTSGGHAWTVTIDATTGVATVTLSSTAGLTGAQASVLVNGLGYANLDKATGTTGERTVTLTSVKDNGGTANGGQDTAQLQISNTLQVTVDQSPTLGAEIGAGEVAEIISSSDDPDPYEGTNSVVQVGDKVYVVRTGTAWNSNTSDYVPISTLHVFQRSADGSLQLLSSIDSNDQNGLLSASGLGVSADGNTLYAITDNGIALFARDSETGALTALGAIGADLGFVNDLYINDNTAYVSGSNGLTVLQRGADGWVAGTPFAPPGDSSFTDLQVSADGSYLYVATTGGNTLLSVFRVGGDGALTRGPDVQGNGQEHYVSRLAVSADGKSLYLIDNDQSLRSLSIAADGALSLSTNVVDVQGPIKQLLVSPDSQFLVVVGDQQVTLHARASDGALGAARALTNLPSNGTELRGANFSADGTQLYLTGSFEWDEGLLVLDLKPANVTYVEGADASPVLPGGTLSDPQLDALNDGAGNYKGASIEIGRDGPVNANDVFGFLDGNGLQFRDDAIWLGDVSIATVASANGTLTITFTADVSRADAQNVLRGITYRNTSADPIAEGDKASFNLTFNDGSGFSDQRTVEVNLVGVNDPAIVDTTALTPTFNAEGERVPLFENTTIDTVEAGQNIHRVIVTITGVTAGDVLGVDGGRINLAQSIDSQVHVGQSNIQYMVRYDANTGTTTVTLYVSRSAEATAEVIDSLSYGHTGNQTSGERNVSLSVVESVADWREDDTTVVQETAKVTLAPATEPNTPPNVDGISGSVPYAEQQEPVPIAPGASIGDTQMDRFNGGAGNYDGATLTITLGDGKSTADSLGLKAGNSLTLAGNALQKDGKVIGSVTVADGVMTITFTDANGAIPTTTDVQNTLRQVTYANSSDVPAASVQVSIELADQRGLTSAAQDMSIVITAVNDAPVINDDPILSLGDLEHLQDLTNIPGLSTPTSSVVSSDGSRVYVADSQGNIALFNRNTETGALSHVQTFPGQQEVVRLQLSADGNSLYVLQADGNASTVDWFTVGADGTLQAQGSFSESLWNIKDFALSDDGKNLYLIHTTNLYIYNRDPVTGAISLASTLEGDMSSPPYLWEPREILVRGDLVFVVTHPDNGSTLLVYQRDANGGLNPLAHIHSGETDANGKVITLDNMQHIAVSADGRTIFIANSRTTSTEGGGWSGLPETTITHNHPQQIDAFRLDPATGALTHLGTINDTPTVEDIAVSSDGKALFAVRADGSVAYYSAITLEKLDSSQSGLQGANHISVSADGAVIITGSNLAVLNAPAVPGPSLEVNSAPIVLFPALTLNDAELDAANDYQGASVTLRGQAGDQFGFLGNGTYRIDGERILRDDVEVATLVQNGNDAVLSFKAGVSASEATALLRQVTYSSTSTTPGSHDISIVFNDGEADSAARTTEVTLLPINLPPVVNDPDYALGNAKAGQAYHLTLPANLFLDGNGDSLTWGATGLPPGLSFDPATRTLSGTATLMGQYIVTLTATDPKGASVTLELTLVVENSAPVVGRDYTPPQAITGESYSVTLPADLFSDANDANLTWSLDNLPEWLSFDADTRTLSGTAPLENASFTLVITAQDAHGASVSRPLTLVVAQPAANDPVLPELHTASPRTSIAPAPAGFGEPALNTAPFEPGDEALFSTTPSPAAEQSAPTRQGLLRSSTGSGLADGRGTLSEQLANADRVLTDSGYQGAHNGLNFDGSTLRSSIDLSQSTASRITLELPAQLPDGSTPQRVTLLNGLPLPSWAHFESRTGELRIDRERLQREGVVRLTLVSRDAQGREVKTTVEVRAEGASLQGANEAAPQPAAPEDTLPQRMQRATSGALLSDALELLDQLNDLAGEPVAITTRHSA